MHFQEALTDHGLEKTICRISISKYAEHFVLKSSIFLYAVFDRNYERATADVDSLARRISFRNALWRSNRRKKYHWVHNQPLPRRIRTSMEKVSRWFDHPKERKQKMALSFHQGWSKKRGFNKDKIYDVINLRGNENKIRSVDNKITFPGYHMNNKHWYTLILDKRIRDGEIQFMIEENDSRLIARNSMWNSIIHG